MCGVLGLLIRLGSKLLGVGDSSEHDSGSHGSSASGGGSSSQQPDWQSAGLADWLRTKPICIEAGEGDRDWPKGRRDYDVLQDGSQLYVWLRLGRHNRRCFYGGNGHGWPYELHGDAVYSFRSEESSTQMTMANFPKEFDNETPSCFDLNDYNNYDGEVQ